ncbi:MAG: hypothetical protein IKF52_05695 [Clostridia bacterium]|nr:hypothetical protein [Clostridia bacterium]
MKKQNEILKTEKEFRKFINLNKSSIKQILIFEDLLDHTIFFYCFTKDNLIIATKEHHYTNFLFYLKKYTKIAKKLNFSVSTLSNITSMKLVPKGNNKTV